MPFIFSSIGLIINLIIHRHANCYLCLFSYIHCVDSWVKL